MARLTLVAMRGAANAVYEVRILARFFREQGIVCEVATAVRRRSACVLWNAKVCKKDASDEKRSGRTGWLAFVCVCIDGHVHRVLLARYCYCIARLAQASSSVALLGDRVIIHPRGHGTEAEAGSQPRHSEGESCYPQRIKRHCFAKHG